MPDSFDFIIADTSCLILLTKIQQLELLNRLAGKVMVTTEVLNEFGQYLPSWVSEKKVTNLKYQQLLLRELDLGEASSIALTVETEKAILIIDDLKGRKLADELKVRYSGTLGLILNCKRIGIIDRVTPIIEKVKQTNFRFSESLLNTVISEAGE